MTISKLSKILKPCGNMPFLKMCANFLDEILQAQASGKQDYEIAARYTRNSQPYVVRF